MIASQGLFRNKNVNAAYKIISTNYKLYGSLIHMTNLTSFFPFEIRIKYINMRIFLTADDCKSIS